MLQDIDRSFIRIRLCKLLHISNQRFFVYIFYLRIILKNLQSFNYCYALFIQITRDIFYNHILNCFPFPWHMI